MTTKKKKELQPSSILLTLLILYVILYLLFILSRANEADKTLFDTIGNILGLGINAMTIFFVYKTYKSQKDQIEFQQIEIEKNKKDVEFNRTLDIVYRQLEFTERELKEQEVEWYLKLSSLKTNIEIYQYIRTFKWIFKIMLMHYIFFESLIKKSKLDDKEISIIDEIIGANVNYKLVHLFWFLKSKMDSDKGFSKEYLVYIKNLRIQMELKEISTRKSHEESDTFYKENLKGFEELVKNDMKELLVYVNRFKKAD